MDVSRRAYVERYVCGTNVTSRKRSGPVQGDYCVALIGVEYPIGFVGGVPHGGIGR